MKIKMAANFEAIQTDDPSVQARAQWQSGREREIRKHFKMS